MRSCSIPVLCPPRILLDLASTRRRVSLACLNGGGRLVRDQAMHPKRAVLARRLLLALRTDQITIARRAQTSPGRATARFYPRTSRPRLAG